ncbi:CoA pyrophosphatase [Histidinibacterium lentulum]|uniref:CoA pyrophosphatase n=1 Tax=Histidinibacterium lentulum TaxID=2480588 RepID=A0A3N2R6Q6_9RHOB|nr:CoA pyrophosphatase [Histidinibacterium lentulum]ROU03097.1 CoA pyrophosphatase [Histidinibacterium lentulum]
MTDLRARLLGALARPGETSTDHDLNPDIHLPPNRVLRPAAVLIAVTPDARVILTKRSSRLKHHPGQIAFPGGKRDECDADLGACALREAEEEIGLPRDRVDMLGSLPPHETVTSFLVTPHVALIEPGFTPVPEAGEVDEVFDVPLSHVADPASFRIEGRRWRGRRRRYYAVPWGPYYIWGATARMLRALADRMS